MALLSLNNIEIEFDAKKVFSPVSLALDERDRLALIGRNGCGKTTLLKMITGELTPTNGEIHKTKNLNIAYLEQIRIENNNISILEFSINTFKELIDMENTLREMEKKLENIDHSSKEFEIYLAKYNSLNEVFKEKGGYIYKSKAIGILNGFGFKEGERNRKISSLSGGELVKLKLARLLIDEPDLLLLDEPTNHLDIETTKWLENFLANYEKAIIIVSHDRYFLDKVANKTLELTKTRSYMFKGNYSEFKIKKDEVLNAEITAFEKNQTEIKRQEEIIKRFKSHGTEKLAKRAKSREKLLEKIEVLEMPDIKTEKVKLNLYQNRQSAREVLKLKDITKSFENKNVLKNLNLDIYRQDKIGIIGENGCGKSTLLKIIIGAIKNFSGEILLGQNIDISYYDQNLNKLDNKNTIIEEIRDFRPRMDDTEIRTMLGSFLFTNDEIFKPISKLSGGERARVVLAKLFLEKSNFLIMDEPTNHLDMYTKEVLEDALKNYEGTLIMVSHDRYFLENVANKIVEIKNGVANLYNGSYAYYVEKTEELEKNTETTKDEKKQVITDYHLKKQLEKDERKKQNRIKKLEETLENLATQIENLEHKLFDPKVYSNHETFNEIKNEKTRLETEYEKTFEEIENLSLN